MDRLISQQAAIDAVHKTIYGFFDIVDDDSEEPFTKEEERFLVINKAITTRIKSLPPAQPEQKRGKWLKSYGDHEAMGVRPFFRYCSECNETTVFPYNFCPHCGADMRGEQNEPS